MSKKQTVKTNQDVGRTKVKHIHEPPHRGVQKSGPGPPWGLGTVSRPHTARLEAGTGPEF